MNDRDLFKKCMSHFATGVAVVTTISNGKRYGITVSSFCSVSLEPQLISYCLDKGANRFDIFFEAESFVVNILDETAAETSILFSKNNTQTWENEFSTDLELKKAMCCIHCHTSYRYDAGDHKIIIALVGEKKSYVSKSLPLIYYKSDYHSIQ